MVIKTFKILSSHKEVNYIEYIKEYIQKFPNVEILIGCDSQNKRRDTIYAIVIGLYVPGKGAHVIYNRFSQIREVENSVRLLNEVWFSVETAENIKNNIEGAKDRIKWIDIDLNPDPKFQSNKALTSAIGIVKGMGYNVRHKGNSPVMTYAADALVK